MRYYLGEMVAVLLLAALQTAWAPWLRIGAQEPALVLAAVALVGVYRGPTEGMWTGLCGALCLGALAAHPLGGLFVTLLGCGLLTGLLGQQVFLDRLPLLMLVVAVAVLAAETLGAAFLRPAGFGIWLVATIWRTLYTGVAAAPLAWMARLLLRRPGSSLAPGAAPLGGRSSLRG